MTALLSKSRNSQVDALIIALHDNVEHGKNPSSDW